MANIYSSTTFMEHSTHPDYKYEMDAPTHTHDGINPSCGDELTLQLRVENGVILLYNKVQSRVSAEQDILLDEAEIDAILMERVANTTPVLGDLVRRQAGEFVDDLLSTLRERGLELRSGPVVFVGGGSILLRRQIEASRKVRSPVFVDDIRANAKGYELLYRVSHSGR